MAIFVAFTIRLMLTVITFIIIRTYAWAYRAASGSLAGYSRIDVSCRYIGARANPTIDAGIRTGRNTTVLSGTDNGLHTRSSIRTAGVSVRRAPSCIQISFGSGVYIRTNIGGCSVATGTDTPIDAGTGTDGYATIVGRYGLCVDASRYIRVGFRVYTNIKRKSRGSKGR